MKYIEDLLGNKIHVGDTVVFIHSKSNCRLSSSTNLRTVVDITEDGELVVGDNRYKRIINMYVKAVKELD